ncbi:MAG: hypothetical protein ABIR66_11585, partial [Saprospiraceae bacterium]
LQDRTALILYGKAVPLSDQLSNDYYYLPANLHLGNRPDGTPEFLFIKYTTEERADAGGAQGAILHFLTEWGLTQEQISEATQLLVKLKSKTRVIGRVTLPKILGPVDVNAAESGSFRVISATLSDDKSARIITSGKASTVPGGKTAVASKMDKISAQLFATTLEKTRSIGDLSLELQFKYSLLYPAVKGQIIMDWEKIRTITEKLSKGLDKNDEIVKTHHYRESWWESEGEGTHWDTWDKTGKKIITGSEAREFYDIMREFKAITINIDQNTDSELAKEVTNNFMNIFLQSITTAATEAKDEVNKNELTDSTSVADYGEAHVTISKEKLIHKSAKKKEVYNLSLRMTIPMFHTLTGNIGSWYDGVKNNKSCVSSVNLNDKFYQHRDINFIIDNKVKDVFEQEVNYVTINVRKKRSNGNDFQEQATIDLEYLKAKGAIARFTYARSDNNNNNDLYEYKTQWSLRGGTLYPPNPEWQQGDWQGVTLTCPMVPRTIQFEADLEELKTLGFVRASLQLRYMKYGKEVESNIPITVSQGVALAEKKLFIDENVPGYAYRIILTHKEKGKMALDWDSKLNDDYVYAIIPKGLKDGDVSFMQKISDAAKIMFDSKDGEVKPEFKILDKFLNAIKLFVK